MGGPHSTYTTVTALLILTKAVKGKYFQEFNKFLFKKFLPAVFLQQIGVHMKFVSNNWTFSFRGWVYGLSMYKGHSLSNSLSLYTFPVCPGTQSRHFPVTISAPPVIYIQIIQNIPGLLIIYVLLFWLWFLFPFMLPTCPASSHREKPRQSGFMLFYMICFIHVFIFTLYM